MKDILKDIVAHINSLGIDTVKVSGEDDKTIIETLSDRKEIIVYAETIKPVKDFKGVFGMPNLDKLDLHLKNSEYNENSKINVIWEERNSVNQPVMIRFENANGDFINDYKLMSTAVINEKLKTLRFKGAKWAFEFEPSIASINRFKLQSALLNKDETFLVKTENDSLKFYFGDANTHEGNFVFHSDVDGKLKQNFKYPIQRFISILNLDGDKVVKFSDDGVILITVNSGLINYEFFIPANMK